MRRACAKEALIQRATILCMEEWLLARMPAVERQQAMKRKR